MEQVLKITSSLCPRCLRELPAEVVEADGGVFLRKTCPEHGEFVVRISSDRRWYFESVGAGACCGPDVVCQDAAVGSRESAVALPILGDSATDQPPNHLTTQPPNESAHDPTLIEKASTCIALIEIVETCNLTCPTCYADSPLPGRGEDHVALSLDEFRGRVGKVLERKKLIDILQLSGGEPTVHPQFFELLEGVLTEQRIGYTLLNTNGVLLATDDAFMNRLGALHASHRKFEVYLQFDGPQEAGQRDLRGADLRAMREKVIDRCATRGVPVTLAMTVTEANLPHLGDTVRFALAREVVRGISFQPEFTSGRTETRYVQLGGATNGNSASNGVPTPLTVADIVRAAVEQSDGLLSDDDFTPLPCGDPNCHTVGYLVRDRAGGAVGVSKFIDFAQLQGFLKDRINFDMNDLMQCGCENSELGQLLHQLEVGPDRVLRLFIKPFMDAWTYDQHRIDRCCVHVIGEDGRLESFCRHYATKQHG